MATSVSDLMGAHSLRTWLISSFLLGALVIGVIWWISYNKSKHK